MALSSGVWWIDPTRALHLLDKDSQRPTTGRLYYHRPNSVDLGLIDLYDLNTTPGQSLADIDTQSLPERSGSFRSSDITRVRVYDALRRSGWLVGHSNKLNRVKDDVLRSTIDQDLYITTSEIKDPSSILCFVGGLYHAHVTDPNTGDIYISDGAQTLRSDRTRDDVTVIDYNEVGGCKTFPITTDILRVTEALPRSVMIDVSSLGVSFKDYTPMLMIDGYHHPVGTSFRSTSPTVLEITVSKLNLLRNYLYASFLRKKPLPIPVTQGINQTSDMHDSTLDVFVNSTTIPKDSVMTPEWIIQRLTSVHSAIVLVPKTVLSQSTTVQYETDEPWWAVLPSRKPLRDAVLVVDGKIFSPLYLHTKGYRDRTLLANPYRENRLLWSLLDPLGVSIASPDRDARNDRSLPSTISLTQWSNYKVLGELS